MAKSIIWHSWSYLSITIMSGLLAVTKWSAYTVKSQRILQESFSMTTSWFMLTPFWFNMDSICSTKFPMNRPSNQIMPYFILFLNKFGTFIYNEVNCHISPTTHSIYRLLLWFINLLFNWISLNGLLFLGSTYQAFCFTL